MLRLNAFNNKKVIISKNNEEIKNDVKQSLQNAFNDIDKLDMTALERLVKIINNYKQVLFIGSEFSLANIYLVQLEMVNMVSMLIVITIPLLWQKILGL